MHLTLVFTRVQLVKSQTTYMVLVSVSLTLIEKHCPYNKGAVMWFADSQVKYTYFNFFARHLASENVDGKHHELVIQKTTEMLTQLEDEASMAPKPYALKTFGLTIHTRSCFGKIMKRNYMVRFNAP